MKPDITSETRREAWSCPWCGHPRCSPRPAGADAARGEPRRDEWLVLACPRCTDAARGRQTV